MFKCAPPIREASNREQLWAGLDKGVLDMVVSDHSPCTPALKEGDFMEAWGGIASLQLTLSIIWSEMRQRSIPVERLAEWMSARPAKLAGLGPRKGKIAVGYDADLVVWHPERATRVDPDSLFHRHAITPYAGELLYGQVEATVLRGQLIYKNGKHLLSKRGMLLND